MGWDYAYNLAEGGSDTELSQRMFIDFEVSRVIKTETS